MVCAQCGTELEMGARFCEGCGSQVQVPVGTSASPASSTNAPNSGASSQPAAASTNSSAQRPSQPVNRAAGSQYSSSPGSRYPMLSFISSIYRLLAYLAGAGAIIGLFVGLGGVLSSDPFARLTSMPILLYSLIGGPLAVITLLAIAEAIRVFLSIEENTRRAS